MTYNVYKCSERNGKLYRNLLATFHCSHACQQFMATYQPYVAHADKTWLQRECGVEAA